MAKQKKKKSISLILRNYFITGVVVLIPIGFTLYLSKILIGISSKVIPENINPNNYLPFEIPGLEIILSVIFITIVGGLSLYVHMVREKSCRPPGRALICEVVQRS